MEKWLVGRNASGRTFGTYGKYSQDNTAVQDVDQDEKSVSGSHIEVESIVGVFNPCCCDCDGKCDLRRWCTAISSYGIFTYSAAIIIVVTLLNVTDKRTFEKYFADFENSPDLNEDFAFTFQGFRNTLYTLISISTLMLMGYVLLLAATQVKRKWGRYLCLGLPIATPGSCIVQIVLYFVFQIERTGTVVNYLLLLDMYFAMCAIGLYTTLKVQQNAIVEEKESDLIEFPEFPPNRVPGEPLIFLTNPKRKRFRIERFGLQKKVKDEFAYIWKSYKKKHEHDHDHEPS